MAVTQSVNGVVGPVNAATSFSESTLITPASGDTALVAEFVFSIPTGNTNPTSLVVNWNGSPMSIVSGADSGFVTLTSNKNRNILFQIPNPPIGIHTLSGSWTTAANMYAGANTWKGTDTTTPCIHGTSSSGINNSATVTVNSPVNDIAVGCLSTDGGAPTMGQTSDGTNVSGAAGNAGNNHTAGAGASTNLTASISDSAGWVYAAADIQVPAAAGDTFGIEMGLLMM